MHTKHSISLFPDSDVVRTFVSNVQVATKTSMPTLFSRMGSGISKATFYRALGADGCIQPFVAWRLMMEAVAILGIDAAPMAAVLLGVVTSEVLETVELASGTCLRAEGDTAQIVGNLIASADRSAKAVSAFFRSPPPWALGDETITYCAGRLSRLSSNPADTLRQLEEIIQVRHERLMMREPGGMPALFTTIMPLSGIADFILGRGAFAGFDNYATVDGFRTFVDDFVIERRVRLAILDDQVDPRGVAWMRSHEQLQSVHLYDGKFVVTRWRDSLACRTIRVRDSHPLDTRIVGYYQQALVEAERSSINNPDDPAGTAELLVKLWRDLRGCNPL